MARKDDHTGASRRDFLKFAGGAAPVAVAALAVGATEAEAAEAADGGALQKTDHVRKYLELARF